MAEVLDVAIRWRERRAEVKLLCSMRGRDYEAVAEPWRQLVRDKVAESGRSVVEVVIALSRSHPLEPAAGAVLLAAALDVLEEAPRG